MYVKINFVSFSFVYVRLELDSLLCLFDRFAKRKKEDHCPVIYKFSCQTCGLDLTCAITNGLCRCLEGRENTGNK